MGIEPGGSLLEGTELTVHEGRIVADEHLAAAPGVWVAGDVSRAPPAQASGSVRSSPRRSPLTSDHAAPAATSSRPRAASSSAL